MCSSKKGMNGEHKLFNTQYIQKMVWLKWKGTQVNGGNCTEEGVIDRNLKEPIKSTMLAQLSMCTAGNSATLPAVAMAYCVVCFLYHMTHASVTRVEADWVSGLISLQAQLVLQSRNACFTTQFCSPVPRSICLFVRICDEVKSKAERYAGRGSISAGCTVSVLSVKSWRWNET